MSTATLTQSQSQPIAINTRYSTQQQQQQILEQAQVQGHKQYTTAAATTATANSVPANGSSAGIPHGSSAGNYNFVPIIPNHCGIQPRSLSSADSFGGTGLSLSFGSRFYPGISPGQVLNSLECVLLLFQVFAVNRTNFIIIYRVKQRQSQRIQVPPVLLRRIRPWLAHPCLIRRFWLHKRR